MVSDSSLISPTVHKSMTMLTIYLISFNEIPKLMRKPLVSIDMQTVAGTVQSQSNITLPLANRRPFKASLFETNIKAQEMKRSI